MSDSRLRERYDILVGLSIHQIADSPGALRSAIAMRTTIAQVRKCSAFLISGSQVRALVRPPSSPPKLAVEDLPAERPTLGRLFAIGEGGSCVSAHSLVSWARFGAPVSGGKNPVPGGSPGGGGTEQRHRGFSAGRPSLNLSR